MEFSFPELFVVKSNISYGAKAISPGINEKKFALNQARGTTVW